MALTRDQIVLRAARELRDGYYVNLGIGIPTLVANAIPPGMEVILQSGERHPGPGAVPGGGRGGRRPDQRRQADVTVLPGAAFFSLGRLVRHDPFRQDRSVHPRAMQVSERGDLANWMIPRHGQGHGGAMDLAAGSRRWW